MGDVAYGAEARACTMRRDAKRPPECGVARYTAFNALRDTFVIQVKLLTRLWRAVGGDSLESIEKTRMHRGIAAKCRKRMAAPRRPKDFL